MSLKISEIRELFLNYFLEKGHTIVPSSPLLPHNDPTLLFTTAGMVQFKSFFSENVNLPYTRAASSQKCLRTTDLEQVGKTDRHFTYFEMLGNFSFGDYFKKEAIEYALDFSLNDLKFPKEKIWATVFLDDDDSIDIWENLGIPKNKIVKLGKEDNFWGPVGETGVCGPCSELYFDRGREKGCKKSNCKPGCDCDRFIEFWNIVFNQYHQDKNGNLESLKKFGIDTGAGLERIATLVQEVDSVYETDELKYIINFIEECYESKYTSKNLSSFRIIADHIRAVSFSIADHIFPDRIGRGYVLRRLIRRALLAARKLKLSQEPSLYLISDVVNKIYSDFFPEIKKQIHNIKKIIYEEEAMFLETLEVNLEKLNEILTDYQKKHIQTVSGKDLFLLYGTYGFPLEITEEILTERGFFLDKEGFQREIELDKKKSSLVSQKKNIDCFKNIDLKTEFLGYESEKINSRIQKIFDSNYQEIEYLSENEDGILVLEQTPFYPEGGGQTGDKGEIRFFNHSVIFSVIDTQKEGEIIFHFGKMLKGTLKNQELVEAQIDIKRRKDLKIHHSGTHLLNFALRKFLGNHIFQKSSLVEEDYLRFDFSHPKKLSLEEIKKIEKFVNEGIQLQIPVTTTILPIQEAKETGAIANFEEKYGEMVRVVQMGDRSSEFCGGTHVQNTSQIEFFNINKESSSGVSVRRIEAICGKENIISYYQNLFLDLYQQKESLQIETMKLPHHLDQVKIPTQDEIRDVFQNKKIDFLDLKDLYFSSKEKLEIERVRLTKQVQNQKKTDFLNEEKIESILQNKKTVSKTNFVISIFEDEEIESLKLLGDKLKDKDKDLLVCFLNLDTKKNRMTFLLSCSYELSKKEINCGDLLKKSIVCFQGKGGGKPTMAQGGFSMKDLTKETVKETIGQILEERVQKKS